MIRTLETGIEGCGGGACAAPLPEALLALASSPPGAVAVEAVTGAVMAAAERQGVSALVAMRVAGLPGLAPGLAEGVGLYVEGEVLRAERLLGELGAVVGALGMAGVAAMPLKGPLLAAALFGSPGARASRDLDVLIRRSDRGAALAALGRLGYGPGGDMDARLMRVQARYGGQHVLFHAERAPVEPHWSIAPGTLAFRFDADGVWGRSRAIGVGGCVAYAPDAADRLLMLAIHGAKDRWPRLRPVADVAACMADAVDWGAARERAVRQGCRRVLEVALLLASGLLGAALPWVVEDRVAHVVAARHAGRIRGGAVGPGGPYVLCRDYWDGRERLRDRLAYVALTALTPRVPHYRRLPLPAGLDWLHWGLKGPWDVGAPVVARLRRMGRRSGS